MLGQDRWLKWQQMEDHPFYWSGSGFSESPGRGKINGNKEHMLKISSDAKKNEMCHQWPLSLLLF